MEQELNADSLVTHDAAQVAVLLDFLGQLDEPGAVMYDAALAIADSLIWIGEPAVEPLIAALSIPKLQHIALFTLGQIGDSRATEPLLDLLAEWIAADREEVLAVISALGRLGDRRAVVPLIEVLMAAEHHALKEASPPSILHSDLFLVFASWIWRRTVAGKPQIEQGFRRRLPLCLLQALGRLGDDRAVEPVRTRLADPDPIISATARRALAQLDSGVNIEESP